MYRAQHRRCGLADETRR